MAAWPPGIGRTIRVELEVLVGEVGEQRDVVGDVQHAVELKGVRRRLDHCRWVACRAHRPESRRTGERPGRYGRPGPIPTMVPTRVSTVPISPVEPRRGLDPPTARNGCWLVVGTRATPLNGISREGSRYHHAAAVASAGREDVTSSSGRRTPGTGRSTMAAAAPRSAARSTKSWPSTWKPGTATNSVPAATERESSVTP